MSSSIAGLVLLASCAVLTSPGFSGGKKIIIAHRGACGYLPEHTLAAKAVAHAMGADYLEQDIVLSKDGVPIVLHDIHIDTVTDVARKFPDRKRADGRYFAIDLTLAELKQLKVTERFDPKTGKAVFGKRFPVWQSSFEIPTLEEEIQLVQGMNKSTRKNTGIYPEIKAPAWHRKSGQDISKIVLAILDRYGYRTKADKCFLQCFDFDEVKRIRNELGYQGKLVQLIDYEGSPESSTNYARIKTKEGLMEVAKVADGIGPALDQIVKGKSGGKLQTTDLVKNAHALGLVVHPYTFRSDKLPTFASSMEELLRIFLIDLDVDGAFMDQPDRGVEFLRSTPRKK